MYIYNMNSIIKVKFFRMVVFASLACKNKLKINTMTVVMMLVLNTITDDIELQKYEA